MEKSPHVEVLQRAECASFLARKPPGATWWVDPTILASKAVRNPLRALSERRQVHRSHDEPCEFRACSPRGHNVAHGLTAPSTASR